MTPLRRALLVAGVGAVAVAGGATAHLWRLGYFTRDLQPDAGALILAAQYPGLDGRSYSLATLKGRLLIVNFWATWCAPCREEIPLFVRLQRELAPKNIQFVGISIDQADKVADFAREFSINYPLVIAGMDAVELSRRAGNQAGVLPYTVIIGRDGRLAERLVGGISEARLREVLEQQPN